MLIKELNNIPGDEFVNSYRQYRIDIRKMRKIQKRDVTKIEDIVNTVRNILALEFNLHFSRWQLTVKGQNKSFDQRLRDLEMFIIENKYFPFISSNNDIERSLGRWWKRTLDSRDQVNKSQKVAINRIETKYAAYKEASRVYIIEQLSLPSERRKLSLDTEEINRILEQHSETVRLLNRVLSEDEAINSIPNIVELDHIDHSEQSILFNSLHLELLDIFKQNNYFLTKSQIEDFAKSNGLMANQLIEQINDICYDILDDIIIEDEGEHWAVSEEYLEAITQQI